MNNCTHENNIGTAGKGNGSFLHQRLSRVQICLDALYWGDTFMLLGDEYSSRSVCCKGAKDG